MIEEWLKSYQINSQDDFINAQREIVQEITLSGLRRGGFLNQACFYGGTALRIFYGLDRFSEDLDFSLLKKDLEFTFEPYVDDIEREFESFGLSAEVNIKKKKKISSIESAFLKDNTAWSLLNIKFDDPTRISPKLKVKLEVDRDPPLPFKREPKLMDRPYSQYIMCMVKSDLFAGKMHAVLFRKWQKNEKGRDWYDLVWYIKNKIPLGLVHFNARAKASDNFKQEKPFTKNTLIKTLHERIEQLNIDVALRDIQRFVSEQRKLEVWSKEFFHEMADRLVVK